MRFRRNAPHALERFQIVHVVAIEAPDPNSRNPTVAKAPDGRFIVWAGESGVAERIKPGDLVEAMIISLKPNCYIAVPLRVLWSGGENGIPLEGEVHRLGDGLYVIMVKDVEDRLGEFVGKSVRLLVQPDQAVEAAFKGPRA